MRFADRVTAASAAAITSTPLHRADLEPLLCTRIPPNFRWPRRPARPGSVPGVSYPLRGLSCRAGFLNPGHRSAWVGISGEMRRLPLDGLATAAVLCGLPGGVYAHDQVSWEDWSARCS